MLFRIGVWALTGLMLILCVVFARLFYAPINLDFARDTVLEHAAEFLPGWQVSYGTAQVGWDWSAVRPWVLLENIQLIDRRNRLNATISEAQVALSASSLLTGGSLSIVDIKNAHVNVTDIGGFSDDTDDSVFDELFASGMPTPAVFKPLTEAFSRFGTRLLVNAPGLEAINFSNVSVDVARGEEFSVFSVAAPAFRLEHFRNSLQMVAQLEASFANIPTSVRLSGTSEPSVGALSLSLAFSDMSLSRVASALELPEYLSLLKFPLGLNLNLNLNAAQGLRAAAFEVSVGEGELRHTEMFPDGAPVDYGLVSAVYDVEKDMVTFENLEVSLGGNLVAGEGTVYWLDGYQNPGVRLNLAVEQATVADVQDYWPLKLDDEGRRRGAREWIAQNMKEGMAKNVRFAVNVEPDGSSPYLANSFYEVLFDFESVDTVYLKTMSPLLGASGHGVLTRTEFDMFFENGTIENLPIGGSKAHMHNIHKRGQGIGEFTVALKGEMAQVLALVAPPPVRILDRIQINAARLGGLLDIDAKITLPLVKAVPKEKVAYEISVVVDNARLDNLLGGEGLRDARVSLQFDGDILSASAAGKINDVPMDIRWRENLKAGREDPQADTSLMVLGGSVDQKGLSRLGVDVADYLEGAIQSEATFLGRNLKFRIGYFSADASAAYLRVPQLAWEKSQFSPANINGTVHFDKDQIRIEPLSVEGEAIDVKANIAWDSKNRGIFDATFNIDQLGKNALLATLVGKGEQGVAAVVAADRVDIGPLLAQKNEANSDKETTAGSDFSLALKADELLLLNGAKLSGVKLDASFFDGEPLELLLTGENDAGRASISVVASDEDPHPLTVQSADAGNLLRGLGLISHIEGGDLTLYGTTKGWGDTLELSGKLEVVDATMVAKDKLSPDVTSGVISGVDSYLEDGSVKLDLIEFPFSYGEGLIDLSSAKANGPTLGITMEGQIDTRMRKINVNGVVVPAYGLNSLLGKIPLVGNLFSGGDGKGLFGVAYRVKGTTEAPEISANPLSGLAPGFLRLLFEGKKGAVADVEAAAEPAGNGLAPESGEKEEPSTDTEEPLPKN